LTSATTLVGVSHIARHKEDMTRIVQISVVIVAMLVGRQVLYGWLKQPDALPRLMRQGLNALLAYFAYVMIGLFAFSLLAGQGFGAGSTLPAVLLTLGGAAYVGVGIAALWIYLGKHESGRR
jgi:hypothetical protein